MSVRKPHKTKICNIVFPSNTRKESLTNRTPTKGEADWCLWCEYFE